MEIKSANEYEFRRDEGMNQDPSMSDNTRFWANRARDQYRRQEVRADREDFVASKRWTKNHG
jgi:hypothetical protein